MFKNAAREPNVFNRRAGDGCEINQNWVKNRRWLRQEAGCRARREKIRLRGEMGAIQRRLNTALIPDPIDHVEHQQRLHAAVGETLPGLCERDITKAARVQKKLRS